MTQVLLFWFMSSLITNQVGSSVELQDGFQEHGRILLEVSTVDIWAALGVLISAIAGIHTLLTKLMMSSFRDYADNHYVNQPTINMLVKQSEETHKRYEERFDDMEKRLDDLRLDMRRFDGIQKTIDDLHQELRSRRPH